MKLLDAVNIHVTIDGAGRSDAQGQAKIADRLTPITASRIRGDTT